MAEWGDAPAGWAWKALPSAARERVLERQIDDLRVRVDVWRSFAKFLLAEAFPQRRGSGDVSR